MTTEPKITELTAEYGSAALKPVFGPGVALVWKRHEDGSLLTNVLWQVRHHSPSGFEIGYGGSGPADLALNMMAALFPIRAGESTVQCFHGHVTERAWSLHQDFKFAFLAGADRSSGCLEWKEIEKWLAAHVTP